MVTLEDHSAVSPTLWQIAGTEVLPEGVSISLVLSVYELEHLARLIECRRSSSTTCDDDHG